ncbi:sensor histidine kinase [Streptomyces marincola]|uniref:Uncharacterized protein n=1 Tax=Streptomyces marincola TaxID=2878388 RepID=A0A1W7CY13_9ACTN|nr:histidine kinase [Streptomyces marincola]ARQ69569.1 hypothetical protein CAG99_12460 [Streptomyces marincola]
MRATGWMDGIRRSSQRARVHHYFAWSLYSFALAEAVLIVALLGRAPGDSVWWVLVLLCAALLAHIVLGVLLTRAGLRHYVGGLDRPDRLLVAFCAVTGVVGALAAVGVPAGALPDEGLAVATYVAIYFAGPVMLVLPFGRACALAAAPVPVCSAALFVNGAPAAQHAVVLGTVTGAIALFALTYRASGWTLRVVHRLDEARETEARLAVAEERLRFGRDLHDVLGRNLSVIALKSELAAQLLTRDTAAASGQMAEVQRIARDSQREIRDVVRGYRQADLHTELVGARGVLQAAGIVCAIEELEESSRIGDFGGGAPGSAGPLPAPVQSALGWVVREGTTNVLRHAAAGRCTVRLHRTAEGEAVLEMENDGVPAAEPADGPEPADGGGGTGLAGLRERVVALGGSLSAGRAGGGTFRLVARVPVRAAE